MLVIPVCEDADIHPAALLPELIHQAGNLKEFKGAENEDVVFFAPPGVRAAQVMFIGLGKKDRIDAEIVKKGLRQGHKKMYSKRSPRSRLCGSPVRGPECRTLRHA